MKHSLAQVQERIKTDGGITDSLQADVMTYVTNAERKANELVEEVKKSGGILYGLEREVEFAHDLFGANNQLNLWRASNESRNRIGQFGFELEVAVGLVENRVGDLQYRLRERTQEPPALSLAFEFNSEK